MIEVKITWTGAAKRPGRAPTIYDVLKEKLGREPTNAELIADVQRIKDEALIECAAQGKLRHQKRRR